MHIAHTLCLYQNEQKKHYFSIISMQRFQLKCVYFFLAPAIFFHVDAAANAFISLLQWLYYFPAIVVQGMQPIIPRFCRVLPSFRVVCRYSENLLNLKLNRIKSNESILCILCRNKHCLGYENGFLSRSSFVVRVAACSNTNWQANKYI